MSDDDDDASAYPSRKVPSSFKADLVKSKDSFAPLSSDAAPPSKKKSLSEGTDVEGLKSKSRMESLLPLVSFLDFWDDDRSRNWISFIEVSSVVS
jgi:hypothetical protein